MTAAPPFANYSLRADTKHDQPWYEWCVFVKAPQHVLDSIHHIDYTLHPTFPTPLQSVANRNDCFALYSAGWGEFAVGIELHFADGTRTLSRHWLKLAEDTWPRRKAEPHELVANEHNVYASLFHPRFRWRKLSTVGRESSTFPEDARTILTALASRNLVRKAPFASVDGQEMWGATAIVGIAPQPLQP
jgi:hypothetical protein